MGSIPTRSRHRAPRRLAAALLVLAFRPAAGQEVADTAAAVVALERRDTTERSGPSPLAALGRSLVLPGWGQVATGRPGRGAVYFGAEAASLFMLFKTQSKLDAARRAVPVDSSLIDARVAQREDWIVLAAFFALMSGVDAWVSAHLQSFEGEVRPPPGGSAGVELRWKVAVGGPHRP